MSATVIEYFEAKFTEKKDVLATKADIAGLRVELQFFENRHGKMNVRLFHCNGFGNIGLVL